MQLSINYYKGGFMKYIIMLILAICMVGFSQLKNEQSFALSSTIDEQDPPENIQVDTMPSATSYAGPKYPESARKLGVEATIWIKLVVNEKGEASKVVVFNTKLLNEGKGSEKENADALNDLNGAAVDAAKQWKFNPAILNGKPIKVWVTVPFKFRLDSAHKEEKKIKKK